MSPQHLPIKTLKAIWFKRYAKVADLNKQLKTARRLADRSPYQTDQLAVIDLEKQVRVATDSALAARSALEAAKNSD